MKQNYKLGQLVEFKTTSSSDATGVIEAVVIRVTGVTYFLKGYEGEVKESQIFRAYKPIGPVKRVAKKRTFTQKATAEAPVTVTSTTA